MKPMAEGKGRGGREMIVCKKDQIMDVLSKEIDKLEQGYKLGRKADHELHEYLASSREELRQIASCFMVHMDLHGIKCDCVERYKKWEEKCQPK